MWTVVALTAMLALVRAQDAPSATAIAESQYWHDRYHGILSMSAYGDYATNCPQFFTQTSLLKNYPASTEVPFTILTQWGPTAKYGITGYNVIVPEMNKVVMVFAGIEGWQNFNATPVIQTMLSGVCQTCTVHAAAQEAYLEAKTATNDWADVKAAITSTGHIWSMTGHGFGGMLAQVAAVDLGYRGLGQAVHTFGSPPVWNADGAALYNKLYEGESSFRTVANEDSVPQMIPQSSSFQHVLTGWHVFGTNATFGQNYVICGTDPKQSDCLGGNSLADHYFYYTQYGTCAQNLAVQQYNTSAENAALASVVSAYNVTATAPLQSSVSLASTSSASSSAVTTTSAPASSSIGVSSTAGSSASPSASSSTSGASSVSVGSVGAAVVGAFGAAVVALFA